MPETKIASAVASDSNVFTDYSVATDTTDGPSDSKETRWTNVDFPQYLGYYKSIPELKSTIDTKAKWVIGEGFKAKKKSHKEILEKIRGWGKDTFNTILQNCVRTYYVGGDSFCEIIRNESGKLINLKPLDPSTITIIVNGQGMLERYEQNSKVAGQEPQRFEPDKIFHLAKNRFADEIHGSSIIKAVEEIILMRNEAMSDNKLINHRYAYPRWIIHLDTDDPTQVAKFKTKYDKANANGENMYVPKGVVEPEAMNVSEQGKMNLLPWIQDLTSYFYQATNTPEVIVGSAGDSTEASSKVLYTAFRESVIDDQGFVVENVKSQLNIEITLEPPVSLIEPSMQQDEKKDGPENKKPNMEVGTTE